MKYKYTIAREKLISYFNDAKNSLQEIITTEPIDDEKLILKSIQLGEVLTFCKNITGARSYTDSRNKLTHRFMYMDEQGKTDFVNELKTLLRGPSLERILLGINKDTSKEFSKESRPGYNQFPFEYSYQFTVLEKEIGAIKKANEISDETSLENHLRNAMTIVGDLTNPNNTYNGRNFLIDQNKITRFNDDFFSNKGQEFAAIFYTLKEKRNNLSHVNNQEVAYTLDEKKEIANFFIKVHELGYFKQLQEISIGKTAISSKDASDINSKRSFAEFKVKVKVKAKVPGEHSGKKDNNEKITTSTTEYKQNYHSSLVNYSDSESEEDTLDKKRQPN